MWGCFVLYAVLYCVVCAMILCKGVSCSVQYGVRGCAICSVVLCSIHYGPVHGELLNFVVCGMVCAVWVLELSSLCWWLCATWDCIVVWMI